MVIRTALEGFGNSDEIGKTPPMAEVLHVPSCPVVSLLHHATIGGRVFSPVWKRNVVIK